MPYFISYQYGLYTYLRYVTLRAYFNSIQPTNYKITFYWYSIVMGDETWIHHFEPEFKWQSMKRGHTTSSRKMKFRSSLSAGKILGTFFRLRKLFFWTSCIVPTGITVKSDHYIETPRHLNDCLHWVRPIWKMSRVLHHHGNITELLHPAYSSDLAPADYYLILPFKKKGACKGTVMPVTMHRRVPCASGCRGWRANLPGRNTFSYTEVE